MFGLGLGYRCVTVSIRQCVDMSMSLYVNASICLCVDLSMCLYVYSGGFRGGRMGRAPPPPKIRKAYVIQR